mmetsp:Transcript_13851/g.46825  ORF Transcript_13851/g.46825 Transcript_13851/m.46825 type:complete len:217 (+) Transcript_13851:670-1320(+)
MGARRDEPGLPLLGVAHQGRGGASMGDGWVAFLERLHERGLLVAVAPPAKPPPRAPRGPRGRPPRPDAPHRRLPADPHRRGPLPRPGAPLHVCVYEGPRKAPRGGAPAGPLAPRGGRARHRGGVHQPGGQRPLEGGTLPRAGAAVRGGGPGEARGGVRPLAGHGRAARRPQLSFPGGPGRRRRVRALRSVERQRQLRSGFRETVARSQALGICRVA